MYWSGVPSNPCIFWLKGMAGTGKSTIARTVARRWADHKRLAASFFFSRGQGDLARASKFFATLAYQLAYAAQPSLAAGVRKAIRDNPSITSLGLREQWKHLIFEPLSQLSAAACQQQSLMLVIDALDECDDERDIALILQLLSEAKTLSSVQLQIFVTSRPETPIRYGFSSIPETAHRDFILHEISSQILDHDITAFLRHEFDRIRRRCRYISREWPAEISLSSLVRKADGLFIFAATVCRFIGSKNSSPQERLTFVLEDSMEDGSPTKHLDLMYTKILQYALKGEGDEPREHQRLLQRFRQIVGSIVILFEALTPTALATLLDLNQWKVEQILESLSSVLSYYSESEDLRIRLLHPSFRDFLLDERRCDDLQLRIDGGDAHGDLAMNCLQLLSKHLKQDICSLKLAGSLASDVDRGVVNDRLPQEVQYACLNWVDHLQRSNAKLCDGESLHDRVHTFFKEHFLHWLEALSLMKKLSDGVLMVKTSDSMLSVSDPTYVEHPWFWRFAVKDVSLEQPCTAEPGIWQFVVAHFHCPITTASLYNHIESC